MDYVDYYKKLIEECGCEAEILFANQAEAVLTRVKNVLCCDIHTRFRTKRRLAKAGAEKVLALDDLLTASVNGSGYNEKYGLLGSNKSSEDKVKLFPRNGAEFVDALAAAMRKATFTRDSTTASGQPPRHSANAVFSISKSEKPETSWLPSNNSPNETTPVDSCDSNKDMVRMVNRAILPTPE